MSGRPGADGAPLGRLVLDDEEVVVEVLVVLEVVFGWEDGGAMRRDWVGCGELSRSCAGLLGAGGRKDDLPS